MIKDNSLETSAALLHKLIKNNRRFSGMTSTAALPPPYSAPLSSDSDSDTSSPTHSSSHFRHADLSSSIFQSYISHSSSIQHNQLDPDLSKIQSFLTSSRSGALPCLICLERIKPTDPTWSCNSRCFAIFHLLCIQSWARQSTALAASRASIRAAVVPDENSFVWPCPKCRTDYLKSQTPRNYYCFCEKLQDPKPDPWILPHSCGEICGKALKYDCGHYCLLLCHPGPCPSCPKLVKNKCFCGKVEDVRRCGFKHFSCNNVCGKLLECGVSNCGEICHNGPCPPCREKGTYRCRCGKTEMEKVCCERDFRCENDCNKLLACGRHVCEMGCHEGDCHECPLQGRRTCPCGKKVYEGMPCDAAMALCGATCDKMLNCGFHRCPERCHRGPCIETCRTAVTKACRCGGLKKQVPCFQELTCQRKCQNMRDCGRHACKRRCCDGDCPPCSEVCERKLRCRNHKCPAPCHRGSCAPCPLMVRISCSCGETHFEVPCGTELEQKPPKCSKPCRIAPVCGHGSDCKPHRCHYGACPPCRLTCDEEYSCGHSCKLRCHGSKPPPLPEFSVKPKKKRLNHQNEPIPGSPCHPCPEHVVKTCVGQHIGAEKTMVCSKVSNFSCENLCGNPLPCGNHHCTYACHSLKTSSCEQCPLPCQKARIPSCPHPCPRPCHAGECPPCKALIKRACHCGSMVHVFECIYFNSMSNEEQIAARSCKGPCHRKLPNCTHLCPKICHSGPCPLPDKCSKKVIVRCGCQTIRKEWMCNDVQEAYRNAGSDPKDVAKNQYGIGLLPCEKDCKSKLKQSDADLHLRNVKPHEKKEEPGTNNNVTKRRRRKQRVHEEEKISTFQKVISAIQWALMFLMIAGAVILLAYFGYKGLMCLSDWMNENENRQRRRYSRV